MDRASRKGVPRARTPDGPLTPEQQELVLTWYEYAIKVFIKGIESRADFDKKFDIEGIIALELCRLARRFDPTRGLKFKTMLANRMVGLRLDLIREGYPVGFRTHSGKVQSWRSRWGWAPAVIPFSQVKDNLAFWGAMHNMDSGDDPVGWEIESLDEVEALAGYLTPPQREAILLKYTDASCTHQLGVPKKMGVTEWHYLLIYNNAMKRLREVLACQGRT